MIYLKLYAKDKDYQDVLSADQLLLPNVSHTIDANEVYYNPIQGANEIWYTSVNGGKVYVNPDSFSGATGELLTVQSHIYADGIGRISFNDDVVSIGEDAFGKIGVPQSIEDESKPIVAKVATYHSISQSYDNLLTVTFPTGVKELKHNVFQTSELLKEINIPKTLIYIAEDALSNYNALNKINVASGNTAYSSEGNCLTQLSNGLLLKGTNTSTIPNNVKSIYCYAFSSCTKLTNINIPNSVTFINHSAFSNCTGLTKITIPDSVTSIEYETFFHCTGLTSVIIGNSVTVIKEDAFRECSSLTEITIPNNVTKIGNCAFYSCDSLQSITILATTPPSLDSSSAFYSISSSAKIYVPSESVDAYKTAQYWSLYNDIIQKNPSE